MDKHILSSLKFLDYKFKSVGLELNEGYKETEDSTEKPLSITTELEIKLNHNVQKAMITIQLGVFDKKGDEYPYKINVCMIGFFEYEQGLSEEDAIQFCKLNGTAIMFPYLRSAITDLTKISNVEPLILPAINIHNLIQSQGNTK